MEKLIIQLGFKQGHMTELCRSKGDSLSLGRAYDNNLVVSDPYIAPHQLRFNRDQEPAQENWQMQVLDQTNPVLLNGEVVGGFAHIQSGDRLTVGRTHLSIFSDQHQVESTRKLPLSGWSHHGLKALMISFFVLFLVCVFDISMGYLEQSTSLEWKDRGYSMLTLALVIVIWSGFWAIAGRLFTHQHHFSAQLLVSSLAVAGYIFLDPIAAYLEYMSASVLIGKTAHYITVFFIFSLALKLNLFYATHINKSTLVAMIMTGFLISFSLAKDHLSQQKVETKPQYSQVLKPPFARLGQGITLEAFFVELNKEVDALNQEVERHNKDKNKIN